MFGVMCTVMYILILHIFIYIKNNIYYLFLLIHNSYYQSSSSTISNLLSITGFGKTLGPVWVWCCPGLNRMSETAARTRVKTGFLNVRAEFKPDISRAWIFYSGF